MKKFDLMALIVIVLMVCMLVLQFIPSWPAKDDAKISTSNYVWLSEHNKDTTKAVQEIVEDKKFKVDEIVAYAVLMLVLPIFAIVACVMVPKHMLTPVLPIGTGVVGILALTICRGFKGYQDGTLLMIVSIACIAAGIAQVARYFMTALKERQA